MKHRMGLALIACAVCNRTSSNTLITATSSLCCNRGQLVPAHVCRAFAIRPRWHSTTGTRTPDHTWSTDDRHLVDHTKRSRPEHRTRPAVDAWVWPQERENSSRYHTPIGAQTESGSQRGLDTAVPRPPSPTTRSNVVEDPRYRNSYRTWHIAASRRRRRRGPFRTPFSYPSFDPSHRALIAGMDTDGKLDYGRPL